MVPSKVTVVGAGAIGSTILYTLMLRNSADQLVMVNRNTLKGNAKASDISHCTGLKGGPAISSGSFQDSMDSDVVIITAGVLPDENGTRMDVLSSNIKIYKEIIPEIVKYSPNCVLLILTNPVDIMAYAAYRISGFPTSRVIGTGTLLDTIRLRKFLRVNDAIVIGEHGDTQFPVWSGINKILSQEEKLFYETKTKRAGWDIRLAKEHSCYAIAYCTVNIAEAVLEKNHDTLPVSTFMKGQFGIEEVFLSLPAKLCRKGVKSALQPPLDNEEIKRLKNSAEIIRKYIKEADIYL